MTQISNSGFVREQAGTAKVVTTSDVNKLPFLTSALYVGTGGNLKVTMSGGDDVTFVNIADGSFLPILVDKVFATGTTASNILALY